MKKQIFINILFSLIYEFTYAISGIIVPKLLLNTFGSEVNGLVSSLTSFLGIFVVIEGGMKAVIGAKLYKPLVENDTETFNKIIVTGKRFYKKLGFYYAVFAIGVGVVYPLIKQTSFSFSYIFLLTIIISLMSYTAYNANIIFSTIIYADNKSYVIYIASTLSAVLNIILLVIGVRIFPNIHFVKLLTFVAYLLNPLILRRYVKKHYEINLEVKPDNSLLDQRWDGFAHNLSNFVMNNVDIYVLTFFSSLINVSIYSIYSIIIVSIRGLINTISNILTPLLGKTKASNTNISGAFNIQLYITGVLTVIIFSCTYVLIDPFIKIYTLNITDANYIKPVFSFLFVTSELIACLSFPYIHIAYAVGDFRNTKYLAFTETIVNIILSILLVFNFGLIGVILATIVSRIVRIVMQLIYIEKNEKDINVIKSIIKSIEKVVMIFVIVLVLNNIINFTSYSYISWITNGLLAVITSCLLCIMFLLIFDRKTTISIIKDSLFYTRKKR